jgi:hypothetical protein
MTELENRDGLEARLKREILRVLQSQMDNIIRQIGDPPRAEIPASTWVAMANELTSAIRPVLKEIYLASAEQAAGDLPQAVRVDWHLANEPAAQWAEQYTFGLVKGINDTSKERLQSYISDFFRREGATVDELRTQISGIFGEVRADMIATTEVTRAAAEGQTKLVSLAEQMNPNVELVPIWETSMDEFVCPICGRGGLQNIAGQRRGENLAFKSRDGKTYGGPPAHPRCRCGVRYEARRKVA